MAHGVATAHVAGIDTKIHKLAALRVELTRVAQACAGGKAGECRILEVLADHTHGGCADPAHGEG